MFLITESEHPKLFDPKYLKLYFPGLLYKYVILFTIELEKFPSPNIYWFKEIWEVVLIIFKSNCPLQLNVSENIKLGLKEGKVLNTSIVESIKQPEIFETTSLISYNLLLLKYLC